MGGNATGSTPMGTCRELGRREYSGTYRAWQVRAAGPATLCFIMDGHVISAPQWQLPSPGFPASIHSFVPSHSLSPFHALPSPQMSFSCPADLSTEATELAKSLGSLNLFLDAARSLLASIRTLSSELFRQQIRKVGFPTTIYILLTL